MSTNRSHIIWLAAGVIALAAACTPIPYQRATDVPPPGLRAPTSAISDAEASFMTATRVWANRATQTRVAALSLPSQTATPTVVPGTPGWAATSQAHLDQWSATGTAIRDSTAAAPLATAAAVSTRRAGDLATARAGFAQLSDRLPLSVPAGPPFKWPMQPLDTGQLLDAQACDIRGLAETRYPPALSPGDLRGAFQPATPCDWAVLAAAYAAQAKPGEPPSQPALLAYYSAVMLNPAYSILSPLYYGYFGRAPLVEPPPLAGRVVKTAVVHFGGHASPQDGMATFAITGADAHPGYFGSVYDLLSGSLGGHGATLRSRTLSGTLRASSVQSLLGSFTDLVPLASNLTVSGFERCQSDPHIYIQFELFLDDGSSISATTSGGTFVRGGGPWQVDIGGVTYLQTSPALSEAFRPLSSDLSLPGSPLDTSLAPDAGCELINVNAPLYYWVQP